MTPGPIKFGILPSPQFTSWSAMRDIARRIDDLGFASLYCSDHLYAPYPGTVGPAYEAYTILGGWAAVTERVQLGAMVSALGFRDPALLAKMVTTLDHVSNGRAVLSIGAGWFDDEHKAFGFDFPPPGERVSKLAEALRIIRGMLDGERPSGEKFYTHDQVANLPAPIQSHLPILIGGRGERMLGLVARYADIWNLNGLVDDVREKDETLRRQCEKFGRDEAEIERQYHAGPAFIRDTVEEAQAVCDEAFLHHGLTGIKPLFVGPADVVAEALLPYVQIGFRHIYFDAISPYDEESLVRLMTEVHPLLTAAAG